MQAFPSGFLWWLFHPEHVWHQPQGHCELAKATLLLRTARLNSTNWLFSNTPRILRARFQCMMSFTSSAQPFYLGFLFWHLWTTHPPRATHPHLCSSLYLTHVLSRKVLSLTKPKGKIYKTKSLGHYITNGLNVF